MSNSINSNIPSLRADREINTRTNKLNENFKRLASGKRIEKPSTDPAGLAIALDLLTNADSNAIAARNINDGVSLANVAEGALQSASDITTRMNELATQSANGTLSDEQRTALDQEYQALSSELDRIAGTTEFNGSKLLDGNANYSIQAGTDGSADSQISLPLPGVDSASLGLSSSIATAESARQALDEVAAATSNLSSARGEIGASVSRLDSAYQQVRISEENQRSAASRIQDVDVAAESANKAANQIGQRAALAVKAQANIQPEIALRLLS